MYVSLQLPFKSLGVDYQKIAYERSTSSTSNSSAPPTPGGPPVNRLPPIEKVAPPQITQNVRAMFETGELPDLHEVKKMEITVHENKGAGVFENEPTPREGVTRETDETKDEFKEGYTRELRTMWLNKENEGPTVIERAPVKLAEDEGCILENEPTTRDDVLRESDLKEDPNAVLSQGHASSLREKFLNINDDFPKERGPVKLFDENDTGPVVFENVPSAPRADVVRDVEEKGVKVQRGKARNLKTFFSNQPEYQKENRPLDIAQDGGIVLESQPVVRSDVVRESDMSESDKSIRFEAGRSRNMASMWQNRRDEFQPKEFKMDVSSDGPTVIENEPTVREDVVRESQPLNEQITPGEGHLRQMATRFLGQDEDDGRRGPKEMIQIERGDEPDVVENEPVVRTDVIKCESSYSTEGPEVQSGLAKGLVNQWLNTNDEMLLAAKMNGSNKPRWQIEFEEAQRQKAEMADEEEEQNAIDGVDPDEVNDQNVLIPDRHTSSMRTRWIQMQEEEEARLRKDRCPEVMPGPKRGKLRNLTDHLNTEPPPPQEAPPPPTKPTKSSKSGKGKKSKEPPPQPQPSKPSKQKSALAAKAAVFNKTPKPNVFLWGQRKKAEPEPEPEPEPEKPKSKLHAKFGNKFAMFESEPSESKPAPRFGKKIVAPEPEPEPEPPKPAKAISKRAAYAKFLNK